METNSLRSVSFRDEVFLATEGGLRPDNVMEYFYQSPFYTESGGALSVNEMVRRGAISSSARMDGDVYSLVSVKDNSIYVIQKFKQIVRTQQTTPLMTFYVICGTVFLAPGLGQLLESHLTESISEFENMFDNLSKAFR